MAYLHEPDCPHLQHVCVWEPHGSILTCPLCTAVVSARGTMRARVVDNLTAAYDDAVTAGQVVRAQVISNMIDRVNSVQ